MRVYLAGPINGCTDEEVHGWRDDVKARCSGMGITWLDPSERDFRGRENAVPPAEIVDPDLNAMYSADAVLGHPWKPSVGTPIELWEAGRRNIRVLLWAEKYEPWLLYWPSVRRVGSILAVESWLGQWAALGVT